MRLIKYLPLLAVLMLAACGGGSDTGSDFDVDLINNPNSAEGYDNTVQVPVMTFDQDMHDFGRLSAGENISYSFHFRNTGSADLIISGCSATCGCTVASYPKERIAPGGDGYITVSFNSTGKSGQQFQEVTVMSNAQPARSKLKIAAQVGY
jgi:hypothetical protein